MRTSARELGDLRGQHWNRPCGWLAMGPPAHEADLHVRAASLLGRASVSDVARSIKATPPRLVAARGFVDDRDAGFALEQDAQPCAERHLQPQIGEGRRSGG